MTNTSWEMAISMYMIHLGVSRKEACDALGIEFEELTLDEDIDRESNSTLSSTTLNG
ncbi:hypothetical protein [Vibrio marisflavi]|uniref:Uncharacterized protein n=1 Tax=Vibrio marisflavi CECT 7928 TaxID=634439 RepID=A0ABN8E0U8_9VIBR|nr:hypothetical protein [Vibrio marisflavi]CAH0538539.1 hypothetical protein VMF7928_01460 [Vibrio marisflavi CECT 7928]